MSRISFWSRLLPTTHSRSVHADPAPVLRDRARVELLVRRTRHAPRFRATTRAYLPMATSLAAARAGVKRGRGAHPPAGTRIWVGGAPSDSLLCPICIDVFQQARCEQQAAARRAAWALPASRLSAKRRRTRSLSASSAAATRCAPDVSRAGCQSPAQRAARTRWRRSTEVAVRRCMRDTRGCQPSAPCVARAGVALLFRAFAFARTLTCVAHLRAARRTARSTCLTSRSAASWMSSCV
jgi:hypothetical protein